MNTPSWTLSAAETTTVLQFQSLSYRYGRGRSQLEEVTATFHTSVIAVLGPNGAGKSTLLQLLATVRRPRSGAITIDGRALEGRAAITAHRASLGYLPQQLDMLSSYTCRELLTYAAWLRKVPSTQTPARVAATLEAIDLIEQAEVKVGHLSMGMRQRLSFGQAVINRPRLLLLDEPTASLDPAQRERFLQLIRAASHDTTVVLSTHLTEDVASTAKEVLLIDEGRALFSGSLGDFCLGVGAEPSGEGVQRAYLSRLQGRR